MATVYSGQSWTGDYTYTRVKVDYNGTSATARLLYTRTNTWSGATGSGDATFSFGGKSVGFNQTRYGQMTDSELASLTFTISLDGGTYSGSSTGGYMGGSWSVTIPSQRTAPTGLSYSNIRRGIESFTANISISGWGSYPSDTANDRYRELQCWTKSDSGLVEPRRWQPVRGTATSGDITVSNSSNVTSGSTFKLVGNTMYTLGMYASNGYVGTGSQRIANYSTLPYAATLSLKTATHNTFTINYSTPASGGQYTQKLQYSINGGSTWVDAVSITGTAAKTGTFTISGLSPNTSYTIQSRVTTDAGTTTNASFTAKTTGPANPTISGVNNSSLYSRNDITYGTTSFGGGNNGVVELYGGTASAPTAVINSKTSTGNSTYNHTGLNGNTRYYYRARAGAYFGGANLYNPAAIGTRTNCTLDSSGWVTATINNTSGTATAFANFWGGPLALKENTNYRIILEVASVSVSGSGEAPAIRVTSTQGENFQFAGQWSLNLSDVAANGKYASTVKTVANFSNKTHGLRTYVMVPAGRNATIKYRISVLRDTSVQPSSYTYITANNGTWVWSGYSSEIQVVTRPPVPVVNSGTATHQTATTARARLNVTIPADGNVYSKEVQYSYSTNGGSSWSTVTTATTISSGSAQTINIDVPNLPVETDVMFRISSKTTAGTSQYGTFTLRTPNRHQPPTGFGFTLADGNTSLQTWLSSFSGYTNPIFVQGQSTVQAIVPESTKGTCTDGATISKYDHKLVVDNKTVTTNNPANFPITVNFGSRTPTNRTSDYPSNQLSVQGTITDSLATSATTTVNALALSWQAPTITVSGERLARLGSARVDVSGTYARLQDNSLNDGQDMNTLTVEYRILDLNEEIIQNWTSETVTTTVNTAKPFLNNYTGRFTIDDVPYGSECIIQVRVTDHFTSVTDSYTLEIWDSAQIHDPVACDIELWNWKTKTFVVDLSYLVVGDLNIEWELNDVEEVSFEMDLMEFEKKCQEMGVNSQDLLKPYAHDIRIRRNGEYILGCQLVEANIQISNNPPARIQVKGTGFLNLLKDQYLLREAWSGYSYSQMARKLVEAAQKPDCLIQNPTGDIDTSYWLTPHGTVSYNTGAHSGSGCIAGSRSGTGWIGPGTQMNTDSGQTITIDAWVKGPNGSVCYVRERRFITESATQRNMGQITLNGGWQRIQIASYQTFFEDGYILFECSRSNSSTPLLVDDCYIYAKDDDAALCTLNIALGTDTASSIQQKNRQADYEVQNIKDAIIDLTRMEQDNFEFEFLPDRTFNVYARKGSNKLDLEICYPGNVDSMTINRSAANVANKIIALGSGIGDERLQVSRFNNTSRRVIGTRESVVTHSNISLEATLSSQAVGELYDRKDPTNIPKIVIKDGSVNPSNLQTGDTILVEVHGENFIKSTTGTYRVMKISYSLSEDGVESMTLTVEPPQVRPVPKMVRYIRDSIGGNTTNNGNYWTEIEALMLVGNDYVNVARGKTVTCSNSAAERLAKVTDGNHTSQQGGEYAGVPIASATTKDAVTIDLGAQYPIDYIRVWHWYEDGRSFKNNTLSVGTSLVGGATGNAELSDVLWRYSGQAYVETSQGAKSKWIQEKNIVDG